MKWSRWKLGACVSLFLSALVAGSGVAAGMTWRQFIAVFCAAAVTHFGAFLKDHPVESITTDTTVTPKTP